MKMTGYILNVWDSNNHEEDYTKEVFLDKESAIKGAVRLVTQIVEDYESEPYEIETHPDDKDVVTAKPSTPSDSFWDDRSYYRVSLVEVTVWSKD